MLFKVHIFFYIFKNVFTNILFIIFFLTKCICTVKQVKNLTWENICLQCEIMDSNSQIKENCEFESLFSPFVRSTSV